MEALTKKPGPPEVIFDVIYEGVSIGAEVSQDILCCTYTDKRTGEADDIELTLDNGALRWMRAWYPRKGDRIVVSFGYRGDVMLQCGEFEIDEIELEGPPHQITIKGVSAAVTRALRTKHTRAYREMTLADIARQVADRQGLLLTGAPEQIRLGRVTQNQETDLGFLKRLAAQYGHMMSVRGDALYLAPLSAVDDRDAVLEVSAFEQVKHYQFSDKSGAQYKSVTVAYVDPKTGKLVEHTETAPTTKRKRRKGEHEREVEDRADTLKLNVRAENKQQASAMAKAALRDKNLHAVECDLTLIGDRRVVAGNTLHLSCFFELSGDYLLSESRHVAGPGGWDVTAKGQRLRTVEEAKAARARRKQSKGKTP